MIVGKNISKTLAYQEMADIHAYFLEQEKYLRLDSLFVSCSFSASVHGITVNPVGERQSTQIQEMYFRATSYADGQYSKCSKCENISFSTKHSVCRDCPGEMIWQSDDKPE